MENRLQAYAAGLSAEDRFLQFGRKAEHPLAHAFPYKRVVHAGVSGTMLPPAMNQGAWQQAREVMVPPAAASMAYIHIPFCKTKCLYCGFFQNGTNQEAENRYVDHLLKEIEQDAENASLGSAPVQSVFIGGGTPTSLSPDNVRRLLQAVRSYLPLSNDYELTLEGRIHDLVPEKMEVWFQEGVNRISLGVQSFDTKVRRQMGRLDAKETVLARLKQAKSYRQAAVIVDLMYGLPNQTAEVWQEDLRCLAESGADGVDLYQLNVFEASDLKKAISSGKLSPAATSVEQAAMFHKGRNYLNSLGWKRLSHCHWASNNRERSLYNTMALNNCELFAFGCGAGGHSGGYSYMLHRALPMYESMVDQGIKPIMGMFRQAKAAPVTEKIQAQMNQCRLDLAGITGTDAALEELHWLGNLWEEYGLWKYNGRIYQLTEAGEFWNMNMTQTLVESAELLWKK